MSSARQPEPESRHDFDLRPGETVSVDGAAGEAAARRFRDVLGRFPTGVTVVTGRVDGEPLGLTCQSFASVSLDPPLVLVCPAITSRAWPLIRRTGSFAVNLLAADQRDLAMVMATKGADKFAGITWAPGAATGAPLVAGRLGHVECEIEAVHPGGDHEIVLGRVLALAGSEDADALTFYRGRYGSTGHQLGR